VAILENYQQENGDIKIPKALISYMGGSIKLTSD
jgi:seryl-tRNA synthetase